MGKKIAIYGAGTIGACQATLTSGNGYSTVVIGHSEEGLSRCRNTMLQNWNNLIAQKLATAANRRAAMDLVTITNDVSALRDCDIVFEAVSEDVNIKQRVYSIITEVCGRDIIVVSTTSSIDAAILAEKIENPARFLIAHPFQPVHMLPPGGSCPAYRDIRGNSESGLYAAEGPESTSGHAESQCPRIFSKSFCPGIVPRVDLFD